MLRNRKMVETEIGWRINSGNAFFWWDNWMGERPLAHLGHGITSLNNTQVSYFLRHGQWNETLVRMHVPPLLVPKVLSTAIHYQAGVTDEAYWKQTENGTFTCSSAWNLVRGKKNKSRLFSTIWHKQVLFKASFLLWRALKFKLPTNDKLSSLGVQPSTCFCCIRPGLDDIEHIFVTGNFAAHIWRISGSLHNLGKIGGGGTLRDFSGNMIYTFTIPLGFGTNNQAKTQADTHELDWCIQHGYMKVVLEVDSELLTKWLNHKSKLPWKLQQYITQLHQIIN
ncbi:hypothetical protein MTR67_006952 [Solanum verrucosum]|uniref:Reverse transcriptase zinc-binding domain-containing protein n=1 Tax=Solanum verrucosum TaxID=315347 RepID=A0AAF0TA58_SOLVR|nr:hypothetical protein MTR67_006952 [Solanum verrucosum]